jgi:hypothetical protein
MAETHIIAVHTYGSQRVKHPQTQQTVSAHKIGYTSAASDVLLVLYGAKAWDVSSPQASYRYIQIEGDTTVKHGYLLLNVTADELPRAEAVTRRSYRAETYLWRDGRWLELPNSRNADYSEPTARSGPGFNPAGYRPVSPTTGEKETAVKGIHAEKSQRNPDEKPWWWLLGETYPHREMLKRHGARFSSRRRAWYYVGWELPEAIKRLITEYTAAESEAPVPAVDDAPCSDEEAERILGVRLASPQPAIANGNGKSPIQLNADSIQQLDETPLEAVPPDDEKDATPEAPAEPPQIRVIKPQPLPADGEPLDEIQTAIIQAKSNGMPVLPTVSVTPNARRPLSVIQQAYVGELTGSITGSVYCYGYAVQDSICVFVNMGGPRMAVEAIRAKFSKGEIVNLVPWDGPAVELTAGEGNTGMYHDFMQNIPEAKFTSLVLCHDLLVNPNYGGKSTTFILRTDEAQATAKLKHHITELVKVPVFDDWADYLYTAGQTAMLVRKTRVEGGVDVLTINLDVDAWTRLITGGVEQGVIALPSSS